MISNTNTTFSLLLIYLWWTSRERCHVQVSIAVDGSGTRDLVPRVRGGDSRWVVTYLQRGSLSDIPQIVYRVQKEYAE